VATGESSPGNAVVVDFTNGVPGVVQAVPGGNVLYKVACASGGDCLAVGYNSSGGVVVPVVNGTPGAPQVVAGTFYLEDVACPSTATCVAVGRNSSGQGVFVPVTNGVPGAVQVVAGVFALHAVACPSTAVCQAGGSIRISSGWEGAAVLISNGTPAVSSRCRGPMNSAG
jgi:hypothetical protein